MNVDKKALEERDYIIKRFRLTPKELKTFRWLLHYGKKIAQDGKNSPLQISPEDWNENLEKACEKVIAGLDGKEVKT